MKQLFLKSLVVTVSLSFMSLVFLNTFEIVFNKDVVIANSIQPVDAHKQIEAIISQFDIKPEEGRTKTNSDYKKLEYVQIPALASNVYLEEKRIVANQWYSRVNMGHYLGLNKDDRGITVDYLIYTVSSWRTIANPNQIEQGMDVKLFYDGRKQSVFSVEEKKVLPMQTTFVASKAQNRQIILLIEDQKQAVYYAYSLVLKD